MVGLAPLYPKAYGRTSDIFGCHVGDEDGHGKLPNISQSTGQPAITATTTTTTKTYLTQNFTIVTIKTPCPRV